MAATGTAARKQVRAVRRTAWRRTVPHTAGAASGRPSGGRTRRERAGDRLALQMAVCGGAFVLLVAAKLLLPGWTAALGRSLGGAMERNVDVREVFSAVGRAVSGEENGAEEVWQAVFRPMEPEAPDGTGTPDNANAPDSTGTPGGTNMTDSTDSTYAQDSGEPSGEASAGEAASLADGTAYTVTPGQGGMALDVLRQYRPGSGASSDAQSETQSETQSEAQSESQSETQSETRSGTQPGSPVLPERISMEQVILNFNYRTPVFGTLTSGFGLRTDPIQGGEKFHHGVDLAVPAGTDILCFADGTVSAVGESTSYGKYCIVDHAGGCSTLYAHCSRITASSGAAVSMGQKIAEAGATGAATGPHLHFELHQDGAYLNPIYYVSHD